MNAYLNRAMAASASRDGVPLAFPRSLRVNKSGRDNLT